MNPVSVKPSRALAGEILVGGHRVMDGDRREVEEEWLVLGLGFKPGRSLVGEHLHHALIFAARGIELEDAAGILSILGIFGAVCRLIVVAVGGGARELHASGDLAGAEPVDEAVLDEDAGEITVVAGDAKMVVEADI